MKDYRAVIEYLKKTEVDPKDAMETLKKALEINPTNPRTKWKMKRFEMYIHQRIDEDKKGLLGKKVESVRRVVASKQFRAESSKLDRLGIMSIGKFDPELEVHKLNKLISDPRQYPYFKSKFFKYPQSNKKIPQDVIDKLR